MFDRLVAQIKNAEGVSEKLKAENQMERVGLMNSISSRAEEIVLNDLFYNWISRYSVCFWKEAGAYFYGINFAAIDEKWLQFGTKTKVFFKGLIFRSSRCLPSEGTENVLPFIKHLLRMILAAYKDLGERVALAETKLPALEMVRRASENKIGRFNKQDTVSYARPSATAP